MKRLIKARRYRSLLLVSTSLLSACGGNGQLVGQKNQKSREPSDVREIDKQIDPQLTDRAHVSKAFEALSQSCFSVGGVFDDRERNCACPDSATGAPQSFQAIYRMDPNPGLKRRVFDHFECMQDYQLRPLNSGANFASLLTSGRDNFLNDLREVRNIGNGRSLVFEIDDTVPANQLQDLANYLDARLPYIHIPSGNQWREMYRIKVFKADDSLDRVKRLPYFDFEDTGLIERYGNEIFIWTLDDFQHLAGRPASADLSVAKIPVASNPLTPALMDGLRAYQAYVKGERSLDVHEDVLVVDQGCQILCDYKASFHLNGSTTGSKKIMRAALRSARLFIWDGRTVRSTP